LVLAAPIAWKSGATRSFGCRIRTLYFRLAPDFRAIREVRSAHIAFDRLSTARISSGSGEITRLRRCGFEHSLVPGLFQTPEYARFVLAKRPHIADDELETLLSTRLLRQEILTGDDAPLLYIVLDEAVLHRRVGSAEVMHNQLSYLVDLSRRANVTLQVIPFSVAVHIGLHGGFVIADGPDGDHTVFLDNVAGGQVSENEETVSLVTQRFDALRADALAREPSRDLIIEMAEG
jgi:hypothetical protein